jgi:hypothetical protein
MTDTKAPEYTAEQVENAKVLRTAIAVLTELAGYADESGSATLLDGDTRHIRTILSEVKRLTGVFSQNLDLQIEIESLRSRLESAERDSKRLDWLDGHAGLVAGDLTPETQCRDAAFGWVKVPRFGDSPRALRDAIDAASAHSPTPTQGGTNG